MSGHGESMFKWFLETRYLKALDRIDGEHMELEHFPHDSLHSRRDSKEDGLN